MSNTILIGALIVVSIVAVLLWATRPKCDMLGALEKGYKLGATDREYSVDSETAYEQMMRNQDPLAPGKTGPNAKPVVYNQGAYRKRPTVTIASSMSKFRPKQGDGKCPLGYEEIMSGERKGMCIKKEYAGSSKPRPTSSSRPSSGSSGSSFTSKVNGKCPSGTSEVTAGGHKGECYKGGSSGGSSGKPSSGKPSSGSTNYGSKFVGKTNGKCPSGTTEITAGSRKGQCIKNAAKENIEYNRKNIGSIYKGRESASCPKGMTLITSGDRKGLCIDEGKVISRGFPYWGWGPNAGLRCRNPDNTGCNTKYEDGKMVSREHKQTLAEKYPHWGWGVHAGLRCANSDNTGCNTKYSGGRLVEA